MNQLDRCLDLMSPVHRSLDSPFGIQAPAEYYLGDDYLSPNRFSSIGWQFNLSCRLNVHSYVEIGSGNDILAFLLRKRGKLIFTVDHNPGISPDLIGILPQLPLVSRSVDAVLCFQVLEHLPYGLLETCLGELTRVCKRFVVVSVPDQTVRSSPKQRLALRVYETIHFPARWKPLPSDIDPEHFWELGHNGVSAENIIDIATKCVLGLVNHFRNDLFLYHHFFVFERLR